MSTTSTHHVALPEGYTVVDRLGAGGYGEVWKATAPGGFEKAVKIVFGHCEDGMAERELKSLERIKSVRHPFLLSIERYEIVNNRLVIVTELADRSLSDCFQTHITDGLTGIPREQLIAYLWDAAEALDCLLEQHSLQHLDIKPENLLVVGDHIKVADFGLVKELASKTLNSMMGGMTPLYSAPEIYDNNPSSRSDQYSLAIVYQHMLTGTLPFSGRTPAQLAKQHTLAQPNVGPLDEADRAIVRKALEKNPTSRFGSCREFVKALRTAGQTNTASSIPTSSRPAPAYQPLADEDTKSVLLSDTRHIEDSVAAAATQVLGEIQNALDSLQALDAQPNPSQPALEFPAVDSRIEDIETAANQFAPTAPVPTLFVGVGGVGIKLLRSLCSQARSIDTKHEKTLAWLAIDTEQETLRNTFAGNEQDCLASEEKLHIPLRRPNQYREGSSALLQWVSRRWLYNIPRSLQTRGFRPLGRIAIVDHARDVLAALQNRLSWLATNFAQSPEGPKPIRVVLLTGMSGGTGAGTVIDIAQAVRSICQEFSQEVIVEGVLASTYHSDGQDSLAAANMFSLLTELNHAQHQGNCGENPPPGPASRFELSQKPFDMIDCVTLPSRSERKNYELTMQSITEYLLLKVDGACGASNEPDQQGLHTFTCINIGRLATVFAALNQKRLLKAITGCWVQQSTVNQDDDAKLFGVHANSNFARAMTEQVPLRLPNSEQPLTEDEINSCQAARAEKIKNIAQAFQQFVDSIDLAEDNQPPASSDSIQVANDRIVAELSALLRCRDVSANELASKLTTLVDEQVANLSDRNSAANNAELVESTLILSQQSVLDCGYRRRSLLISPSDEANSSLYEAMQQACPTLASSQTQVADAYLIREGSGLRPVHLGARLAEIYPDIVEAAGRLHARDDIHWQDLRCE